MNESNKYRDTMESIRFSDEQKTAMTAALSHAAAPTRRRVPVVRAALIAAVVCLVLIGSALAVTVLHSAGRIDPFGTGEKKEEYGYSNPGYTVTYEARRFPLSDFSDQILADAAQQTAPPPEEDFGFHLISGFDSWDAVEEYIGFDLMDNSCLEQAEKSLTPLLLNNRARAHATVTRSTRDGVLSRARADARWLVTENGIPVIVDLGAFLCTEAIPADEDISKYNVLYTEEQTDLEVYDLTGSNGLTVSVIADPDEIYSTYYSAHFTVNGVSFDVRVQYVWPNTDVSHEEGNAAAAAVLQAVIDGFSI